MNLQITLLAAFLVASSPLAVTAVESNSDAPRGSTCLLGQFPVPISVEGHMAMLEIPPQDIEASPPWDPASGDEAPVSVAQAARLATAEFALHFGNREGWSLTEIVLRPLCNGRWVYHVTWQPQGTDEQGVAVIPVLMSGMVVSLDGLRKQGQGNQ